MTTTYRIVTTEGELTVDADYYRREELTDGRKGDLYLHERGTNGDQSDPVASVSVHSFVAIAEHDRSKYYE